MEIDFKKVAKDMITAMKAVVGDNLEEVKNLADDELEDFAKRTVVLARKVSEGKITQEQAKIILKIRQNAVETVLLSIAGIGILAAQEAINAALGVLKEVVSGVVPGADILLG